MSGVTIELEQVLHKLDAKSASLLERLVRDALALVQRDGGLAREPDQFGWPAGYFERTAGSFANEPLDFPEDAPPTPNPEW
jgi:hypothetical protein